uniref:EB domain-containing protein n=1 Tax=Caenorhabditis tropicalis TaxID=1561998 RepID=A0A1I7U7U5_9PELO
MDDQGEPLAIKPVFSSISSCEENEPCRIGRSRSCLCPEDFVCDTTPANKNVHLCVKLGYLRMFGAKK